MAETTDVEVELYEENVGTPCSTSDEMDNSRTIRMQVPFKEPTHNSLLETTSELQKCSGPFRNTLRSLAGDVNCEMPIEAGPDSAHYQHQTWYTYSLSVAWHPLTVTQTSKGQRSRPHG